MQIDISKIIQLPRKERWQHFFEVLKERKIPQDDSPADYPEEVFQLLQGILDQDYREANNGESPHKIDIKNTDLYKMLTAK